jgi:phosphonate transport system permease protein
MSLATTTADPGRFSPVLAEARRRHGRRVAVMALLAVIVLAAFSYAGLLDPARYDDFLRPILTLAGDAMPPDFSRWRNWGKPLLETLAMSIAGTVIGLALALPLGALAARNVGWRWLGQPILFFLNTLRSVPGLVWGVIFVAALGFGPLPGVMALSCHSTGMLGKFCAEMLEHIDPGPVDALRAQGVGRIGVFRFAVWPQLLPRLLDVTIYRWEHNLRAATTLGVVGAGGLGLEIVTAFHLFEYREASALILLLLALVSLINLFGGKVRAAFLGKTDY